MGRQPLAAWPGRGARLRGITLAGVMAGVLAMSTPASGHAAGDGEESDITPATALVVGEDGALYGAESGPDGEWQPLEQVSPEETAPPGASVATLRRSEGRLDAFYVGSQGALMRSHRVEVGEWQPPTELTPDNTMTPGSEIVVVGTDVSIDIIGICDEGQVCIVQIDPDGCPPFCDTPVLLPRLFGPEGLAVADGALAATVLPYGQPGVVFVDAEGTVQLMQHTREGEWLAPVPASPAGVAPPGAGIAATSVGDTVSAFYVDDELCPREIRFELPDPDPDGDIDFGEPRPITFDGIAPAGADLSVLTGPEGGLALFYAGVDGALYASRTTQDGAWFEPTRLSDFDVVAPGTSVTPYARGSRIDLGVNSGGDLLVWWCPWPWPFPPCPCPGPYRWFIPGEIFGGMREFQLGGEVSVPELGGIAIG